MKFEQGNGRDGEEGEDLRFKNCLKGRNGRRDLVIFGFEEQGKRV